MLKGVEHAVGPLRTLQAITLVTRDMRVAVAFYEALGFVLDFGGPDAPFSSLQAGNSYLNLQFVEDAEPVEGGWGRAIFFVDDVDAMYHRVISAGFSPLTQPADAVWGERYFHIRDCDGHELSFAKRLH